jgi:DNA-binding NarL/FixJ family response regulator
MANLNPAMPTCTIAILTTQCLVWVGLQNIFERSMTVQMVVYPYPWRISELLRADSKPDVVILDVETERDAVGTIKQIRESAAASKIVLLCSLNDNGRAHEAFASGVDGIILNVQPPEIVLSVLEGLYAPKKPQAYGNHNGVGGICLETTFMNKDDAETQPWTWPEALTERELEIVHLVTQGLSNKDIAYRLSISDSTVRHHMTNIFDKVGVSNRQKLLVHARDSRAASP